MSNVSKLAIKACSDNKFSSFTGEFITSINPENLIVKSGVAYHAAQGMAGPNLLKYRGSPPKLLTFSLLFDNTGIIPGSNTINVMEQVKQLQDVAYNVNKKNNAPNYIRVIWGQIDFKGRLVDLDITYSMFQVDGTLVRAEASISIVEELPPLGAGKSSLGKESTYAKPSGVNATANNSSVNNPGPSNEEAFAATPNGMNGAYSGAPDGAYDGGPDRVYQGDNSAGDNNFSSSSSQPSSSSVSNANSDTSMPPSTSNVGTDSSSVGGPGSSGGDGAVFNDKPEGVAGNGPGGSGGGVGGGGNEPGNNSSSSGSNSSNSNANNNSGSSEQGSNGNPTGNNATPSDKNSGGTTSGNNPSSNGSGNSSNVPGSSSSAKSKSAELKAAKSSSGSNSLRKIKSSSLDVAANLSVPKMSLWQRLKLVAKKVGSKAYSSGKKLVS